ncbi:putative disease resistance RPP13-like protein 1 [Dichanthelium oligosanthes]|uniref:Putative disease resistance RPP13-like protein 1 n=1 Tax=Dichanthelium oligosanthes TaxID=888268 RepID=A0A1E5W1K9_9POAL|nr:putative disease resistance RPP13-like protein 1 [Dichanthelium oligosanthes]
MWRADKDMESVRGTLISLLIISEPGQPGGAEQAQEDHAQDPGTLQDAEEGWNIREESAKLQLRELKEVVYDIEDVVDEYQYEVNRCKAVALEHSACKQKIHEIEVALDNFSFLPLSPGSSTSCATADLRSLETVIQDPLQDAKLWLRELKEVVYSRDEGMLNLPTVEALNRSASFINSSKPERQEYLELLIQARKVTERFNEIIKYSDHFTLSENDGEKHFRHDISSARHTSSVIFEKNILGRDKDKVKIVEKLLSREGENVGSLVSVMAIVGMGGLGKTTLVQLVYNDLRLCQSFDKHAWVYVSEHFDVNAITRNIINSLTKETCEFTELAQLQEKLADEIKDKRVLLVLDDVWNEEGDCWELLCMPMSTARICQIIISSWSEAVARKVQTMPFHRPSCLSFDESWSLFKQVAFVVDQEFDTPAILIEIVKSIAKKCKGLPLAIKTLGNMLRYESDQKIWEDVLESELWDLEQPQNKVLPVLELSFKHMHIYLRRCFLGLSLFLKVHSIYEPKEIRLWKLLDLLHCNGDDDGSETGILYLKELVQRSILQLHDNGIYHLHDLMHDLACFLAVE